jgi:hypothetical protein
MLAAWCVAAHAQVDEAQLKAAFVYNFAALTNWPDAASTSLVLCTHRSVEPPFERALDRLRGKEARGRTIEPRAMGAEATGCDIVVVDAAHVSAVAALAATGSTVLTICDCTATAREGAAISLVREGSKLRFDIDRRTLGTARLTLSSKLMRLARRLR